MMLYTPCEFVIKDEDLPLIHRMYPYSTMQYRRLELPTLKFLLEHLPHLPAHARIFATSEHNGRGKQWGVVLVRLPDAPWRLVGHFGHSIFDGLTDIQRDVTYMRFVLSGIASKRYLTFRGDYKFFESRDTSSYFDFLRGWWWNTLPAAEQTRRTLEKLSSTTKAAS
jgi:hypothetical protein